ncbi:MAG: class I SAM-dependent methyltransferase [Gemmatimonadales bacterium]
MDLIESGNMSADDEFGHWWISTRFEYVERVLALASERQQAVSVVEFGCGTAQNLRFCRQRSRFKGKVDRLSGVDPGLSEPRRFAWMSDCDTVTPEATSGLSYDVLLAMDVLEHIEDDAEALSHWLSFVKPGGYVLITVPAFDWLWSNHDERLGHVRRYTRSSVDRLSERCGLERIRTRYAFGYVLPIVVGVRKLLRPKGESTDLRRHSAPVNWLFKRAGQLEACFGGNRWAGTSVVGMFRKPG